MTATGRRRVGPRVAAALAVVCVLAVSVSVVGLPVGTAAAAPTPLSDCTDITTPGHYELSADVTAGAGACITIQSSDVVFDGAGFTIDGAGAGTEDVGVLVSGGGTLSNVTVADVTVANYRTNIRFENATDSAIRNVRVETADSSGSAVVFQDTDASVIADSTVTRPNGGDGIELVRSDDNRVLGNDVLAANSLVLSGTVTEGSARTVVTNNTLDGEVVVRSPDNVLRDNVVDGSSEYGISIVGSVGSTPGPGAAAGNIIENNVVRSNSNAGLYVWLADSTQVLGNEFTGNGGGVEIAGSPNSVLQDVVSRDNYGADVLVDTNANTNPNPIAASNLTVGTTVFASASFSDVAVSGAASVTPPASTTLVGDGFTVEDISTITRSTAEPEGVFEFDLAYEEADLGSVDESTLTLYRLDADWQSITGATVDTTANTATATLTDPGREYETPERTTVALAGSTATAAPNVTLTPTSVDFGTATVGDRIERTVTVGNDGTADLTVSDVSVGGLNPGEYSESTGGFVLAPGQTRDVTVAFEPTSDGLSTATLEVTSDDPDLPIASVVLSGEAVAGASALTATPSALDFPETTVGSSLSLTVTVQNDGSAPVTVENVGLSGATGQFTPGGPDAFTLAPGEPRDLTVTYSPDSAGTHTGALELFTTDPANDLSVALSGSAADPTVVVDPFELSNCTTITSAGYYTLAGNITTSDPVCFDVQADDVTIDGQGHWVSGTGTSAVTVLGDPADSAGVLTDVVVRNINVDGWFENLDYVNATGAVESVTISGGRVGIAMENTTLRVQDSTIDVGDQEFGSGISAAFRSDLTVRNTTIRTSGNTQNTGIIGVVTDIDATDVTVTSASPDVHTGVYADEGVVTLRNATLTGGDRALYIFSGTSVDVVDSTIGRISASRLATSITIVDSTVTTTERAISGGGTVSITGSTIRSGDDAIAITGSSSDPEDIDELSIFSTTIDAGGNTGIDLRDGTLQLRDTTVTNASVGVEFDLAPIGSVNTIQRSEIRANDTGLALENVAIDVTESLIVADTAVYVGNATQLGVLRSTLEGATDGIVSDGRPAGATVDIADATLRADEQGVYVAWTNLTVDNTTFQSVTPDAFATGVYVDTSGNASITGSRFETWTGVRSLPDRPTTVTATRNDLSNTHIALSGPDETSQYYIDAPLNYYGPTCSDRPLIWGDVRNTGVRLTAPLDEIDTANIQQFGYCAAFEAGQQYAFGTPAPLAANLSTTFADFEGAVYVYDAGTENWQLATGDETLGALDAVVVVPTTEATALVDFADATPARVTERPLDTQGWHFVAPRFHGDAEDAYSTRTVGVTDLVKTFAEPTIDGVPAGDAFGRYTFAPDRTSQPSATTPTVSPFTGYFVYVYEPGTIPTAVPTGATAEETDRILVDEGGR